MKTIILYYEYDVNDTNFGGIDKYTSFFKLFRDVLRLLKKNAEITIKKKKTKEETLKEEALNIMRGGDD